MNKSAFEGLVSGGPLRRFECPRGKGREKIRSAKILYNPLKSLDSDERIQGNPN
jgi:hypothetical protein